MAAGTALEVTATRAALLSVFKEVYGERIAEQPNRTTWILNEFENSTRRFGGKYWTVPMLDEGGQAVGSFNESEAVEDAQAETTKEIQIKPRQHYALVKISGLAIAASKQNLYAFVQAKDFEIKNKTKWLLSQLNAQFYGRGDGVMGSVAASPAPVNGAGGSFALDTAMSALPTNINWFRKGQKVDVYSAPAGTKRNGTHGTKNQGWQIASVNKATKVITVIGGDTTAGVAAGDVICWHDSQSPAGSDAAGKQLLGLTSLIDDTSDSPSATIQNIDRAVYPIFKATVTRNGSVARALSLDLIQKHLDSISIASGEECDWMVGGYGQRRNYLNLLWYDVRYGPKDLRGGFEVLKYNNLDWVVDKDCPDGQIITMVKEYVKKYVVAPIGILDQAGPQMERVPKTDTYELLIGGYFNIGHERPNSSGRLDDLIEP
jgi:hypothetical protein